MQDNRQFFQLLQAAMDGRRLTVPLTDDEWSAVYDEAHRQSLVGVMWAVARQQRMPVDIAIQWAGEAEMIRGLNALLNREAARLTHLLEAKGRQTAILKGQANARLYPDKMSRQPGDIDIWVAGGQKSVSDLLIGMGLMDEMPRQADVGLKGRATMSYHHVHLPPTKDGVTVEVHFRPASGNFDPITNWRLQQWLETEIQTTTMVEEGFRTPSVRFALVMQLAHIQRHFLSSGVGLRQVCDYYWLLREASGEDRREVKALLGRLGLRHVAGALMWVLREVLLLDKQLMVGEPDARRGEMLLREIMAGGNFGQYAALERDGLWRRLAGSKWRRLRLMGFDFREVIWMEADYWANIVRTLPTRIRYRSLSLKDMPHYNMVSNCGR